ncbi:uncharacterized protein [Drosophila takahashii]|uniref:uncharacterized protein n=1 Tax=Drosophila takahashii TaxID=29030 RepID=UPI0038991065
MSDINATDDIKRLNEILSLFCLEHLFNELQSHGALQYLNAEDIKDAIEDIGFRSEFRENLFNWRKNKLISDRESEEPRMGLNLRIQGLQPRFRLPFRFRGPVTNRTMAHAFENPLSAL